MLADDADGQTFDRKSLRREVHLDGLIGVVLRDQQNLVSLLCALKALDRHLVFDARNDDLPVGRMLRLMHGQQVAIHINDQNTNDQLEAGDYIEFYGQAVGAADSKYAAYNVYWLTTAADAGEPLLRMAASDGAPGVATVVTTHTATVGYEVNQEYWGMAPGDDALDRWFFSPAISGAEIAGGGLPVDYTISLPGAAGDGILEITLYGAYDTEHDVVITVNGVSRGHHKWSGIAPIQVAMDPVNFGETNVVTIECLTGMDRIFVDNFTAVDFDRNFTADGDSLKFSHALGSGYQITGFDSNDLAVYDITDAADAVRINGFTPSGSGPYTLAIEPQYGSGERTYLALSADAAKTPAGLAVEASSSLADTVNGADYLLITHRRQVLAYAAAATPPLLFLAAFNAYHFGSPFRFGQTLGGEAEAQTIAGFGATRPRRFIQSSLCAHDHHASRTRLAAVKW